MALPAPASQLGQGQGPGLPGAALVILQERGRLGPGGPLDRHPPWRWAPGGLSKATPRLLFRGRPQATPRLLFLIQPVARPGPSDPGGRKGRPWLRGGRWAASKDLRHLVNQTHGLDLCQLGGKKRTTQHTPNSPLRTTRNTQKKIHPPRLLIP